MYPYLKQNGIKKNYGTLTSNQNQETVFGGNGRVSDSTKDKLPLLDDSPEVEGERVSNLSVQNVEYVVRERVGPWWKGACFRKIRQKTVLKDVSLYVKSSEITAILGNSGSGKTSLLDVIACRSSGIATGRVSFNGLKCTRDVIQQHATYVMQADRLLPNLTVKETLTYTAKLKLPGSTSASEISRKVTQVILEMGLKDVADSRIGNNIIRGISGGEQRRVTIAIQLLKDPDMVLLDEPTSGLDSYTARYLVASLRDLSRRGKIVLLTIHQPSSDIFHLFDQIGIMSHGQMVYCGPADEMIPYFTALGHPCDKFTNPLDRYVDVASIDRRDKQREFDSIKRVDSLVEAFKHSKMHQQTLSSIHEALQEGPVKYQSKGSLLQAPHISRVFLTVVGRMFRNLLRDRKDYCARIFLLPLFMVFIIIFLGRLKHTQSSIQDRIGIIYNSTIAPPFISIINSAALFLCLRNLYYRECRDGLYGTVTFLTAYSVHCIPFHFLSSVIFSSILYWSTGMHPGADRFGLFTLEIFLLHFWGEMVTAGCMGLVMNPNLANSVAALWQSASVIIAAGYVRTVANLIEPYKWLSWVLVHKYSAEIFIANEFKDLPLECEQNATVPCFNNGNEFIEAYYPGAVEHLGRNFGALAAYDVATLIFAVVCFKLGGLKNMH